MASDVDYIHENISKGLLYGDVPDWGDTPKVKVKHHVYHHYAYDYRTGILKFENFEKAKAWAKEHKGVGIVRSKTRDGQYESEPYWKYGKPSDKEMEAHIKRNAESYWYKDNPRVPRGSGAYEKYLESQPKPVRKPTRKVLTLKK